MGSENEVETERRLEQTAQGREILIKFIKSILVWISLLWLLLLGSSSIWIICSLFALFLGGICTYVGLEKESLVWVLQPKSRLLISDKGFAIWMCLWVWGGSITSSLLGLQSHSRFTKEFTLGSVPKSVSVMSSASGMEEYQMHWGLDLLPRAFIGEGIIYLLLC